MMKSAGLYLILNNNLITGVFVKKATLTTIFHEISLYNFDDVFEKLHPYVDFPIELFFNTSQVSMKLIDLQGMNFWHIHELKKRLKQESLMKNDWHSYWVQRKHLITLSGTFSLVEHEFLIQLHVRKFFVNQIFPLTWMVHEHFKKFVNESNAFVIQWNFHNTYGHILYLNTLPTAVKVNTNGDITDWIQFIQANHNSQLTILKFEDISEYKNIMDMMFKGFLNGNFNKNKLHLFLSKGLNLKTFYTAVQRIQQFAYGMLITTVITFGITLSDVFTSYYAILKLENLLSNQQKIVQKKPDDSNKNTPKHPPELKKFQKNALPILMMLEKLSEFIPLYGHVIFLNIGRTDQQQKNNFFLDLKLVPLEDTLPEMLSVDQLEQTLGSKLNIKILPVYDTPQKRQIIQLYIEGLHDEF